MSHHERKATDMGLFYEQLGRVHCFGAFAYIGSLLQVYQDDTVRCLRECKRERDLFVDGRGHYDDLHFWYRALVRAFFSQVEGVAFVMRQNAAWAAERGDISLTDKEVNKLLERRYDEEQQVERVSRNSLEANVKLAFRFFPMVFGLDDWESPVTRDARWEEFRFAAEVRHGLMHPKGTGDFMIPARDLPRLEAAMLWFADGTTELYSLCETQAVASLQRHGGRIPGKLRRQIARHMVDFQEMKGRGVGTEAGNREKRRIEEALAKLLPKLRRYVPNCRG